MAVLRVLFAAAAHAHLRSGAGQDQLVDSHALETPLSDITNLDDLDETYPTKKYATLPHKQKGPLRIALVFTGQVRCYDALNALRDKLRENLARVAAVDTFFYVKPVHAAAEGRRTQAAACTAEIESTLRRDWAPRNLTVYGGEVGVPSTNVIQYYQWQKAWEMITAAEAASGVRYNFVIRTRTDLVLGKEVKPQDWGIWEEDWKYKVWGFCKCQRKDLEGMAKAPVQDVLYVATRGAAERLMTIYGRRHFSSEAAVAAFDAKLPQCPMFRNATTDHFECRSILDLNLAGGTIEALGDSLFGAYAPERTRETHGFFLAGAGHYESQEHTHAQCASVPCSGGAAPSGVDLGLLYREKRRIQRR